MDEFEGIDLDKTITYLFASFRFFDKGEYHVSRYCTCNVLLLVFEGVLRFTEEGEEYEVKAGEYYIQKANSFQSAAKESEEPKYLYIHFLAEWSDRPPVLKRRGNFNVFKLYSVMEKMDQAAHACSTYTEKSALLLTILSELYSSLKQKTLADQIAGFISENVTTLKGLDEVCEKFSYSKNHIINIFKAEYGMTPIEYLGEKRIERAKYLAEVTSHPLGMICQEAGFNNYSHFYRLFTRKTGMSPEKWREQIRIRTSTASHEG